MPRRNRRPTVRGAGVGRLMKALREDQSTGEASGTGSDAARRAPGSLPAVRTVTRQDLLDLRRSTHR